MARDAIGERYEKRKKKKTLEDLTQRTRSTEDIEAEQAVLDKARQERVKDPEKYRLKGEQTVGRNEPCPCGSGKKFKKCCGAGK